MRIFINMNENIFNLLNDLKDKAPGSQITSDFKENTVKIVVIKLKENEYMIYHYQMPFSSYGMMIDNNARFELKSCFIYVW